LINAKVNYNSTPETKALLKNETAKDIFSVLPQPRTVAGIKRSANPLLHLDLDPQALKLEELNNFKQDFFSCNIALGKLQARLYSNAKTLQNGKCGELFSLLPDHDTHDSFVILFAAERPLLFTESMKDAKICYSNKKILTCLVRSGKDGYFSEMTLLSTIVNKGYYTSLNPGSKTLATGYSSLLDRFVFSYNCRTKEIKFIALGDLDLNKLKRMVLETDCYKDLRSILPIHWPATLLNFKTVDLEPLKVLTFNELFEETPCPALLDSLLSKKHQQAKHYGGSADMNKSYSCR
jgi:hypothetical protein